MAILRLHGDLRPLDDEARLGHEPAVDPGREVAEEHVDPEPVGLDLVGRILDAERGQEEAAGPEPGTDPPEQRGVLGPRDVGEGIEGDDGVEGRRVELEVVRSAWTNLADGTFARASPIWTAEISTPVRLRPAARVAVTGRPAPQPSSRTSAPGGISSSASAR